MMIPEMERRKSMGTGTIDEIASPSTTSLE
jgi:hypothetical protein